MRPLTNTPAGAGEVELGALMAFCQILYQVVQTRIKSKHPALCNLTSFMENKTKQTDKQTRNIKGKFQSLLNID